MSDTQDTLRSQCSIDWAVMHTVVNWAAMRSKDPSTKVGAGVYDHATGGLFLGYNGFPKGVLDLTAWWNARERGGDGISKYDLVVHAEANAITKARDGRADMSRCTLYVSHFPCPRCMKDWIGTSGIRMVVYERDTYPSLTFEDRALTLNLARMMRVNLKQIKELDAEK